MLNSVSNLLRSLANNLFWHIRYSPLILPAVAFYLSCHYQLWFMARFCVWYEMQCPPTALDIHIMQTPGFISATLYAWSQMCICSLLFSAAVFLFWDISRDSLLWLCRFVFKNDLLNSQKEITEGASK